MHTSFDLFAMAHLSFTFCAIVILEAIAVYTWQFRAERGARWHVAAQTCNCLWLAALAIESMGVNNHLDASCEMATWLLAMASVYIWFRFFAEISGYDRVAPGWLEPAIRAGVLISYLFYLSDPWFHLILIPASAAGPAHFGRLCYLTYPFGYAVYSFALGINARWALRCRGLRRRQAVAFFLPNLMIWAGQFLAAMRWFGSYDPHALFFLLSGVATAWAFFRWRAYSVLPLAQGAMLRSMIDGLMVVDEEGYIVRLNPAARAIFRDAAEDGVRFDTIASACPALLPLRETRTSQVLDANWEMAGSKRFFQVHATPLYASAGHLLGQVFCFQDVTLEKAQQARIVEQEKAISLLEERARLGRELHDGQGQTWSYVSMQLCAIERKMELGEVARGAQLVRELRNAVQETHIDLRETITALHTGGDTLKHGLLEAIEEQLRWYREHCGWQASFELDCAWQEEMLAAQSRVQLLRIVQQSLANARKHALADSVRVAIDRSGDSLRLVIEDNGCGFDPEQAGLRTGHHGLYMMKERAAGIGAKLHIASSHGAGTRITAILPNAWPQTLAEETLFAGESL